MIRSELTLWQVYKTWLFLNGYGQWQVKIRKKGYPIQSKTFHNKARAPKWATHVESQMDTKIFVSTSLAENTTFQEICDRYLEEVVPTKKSARQIASVIRNLCSHIGIYTAAAITPELLVGYRDE